MQENENPLHAAIAHDTNHRQGGKEKKHGTDATYLISDSATLFSHYDLAISYSVLYSGKQGRGTHRLRSASKQSLQYENPSDK